VKLLVIDDHEVVRAGLRRLLSVLPGAVILEEASGGKAVERFGAELPDMTILDIALAGESDAGGFAVLKGILATDERARVLMFSMYVDPQYAARALVAGARGYVSKTAPSEELLLAVRRVMEGGRYIEEVIAADLAFGAEDGRDPMERLSPREADIMRLLGEGRSLTEIAAVLGVTYKTVANTCSGIKAKLGVTRTGELIRMAMSRRP
jgi:two-component system, NarL family, invasion response regulator UvrY